jgi:hypothetical protein
MLRAVDDNEAAKNSTIAPEISKNHSVQRSLMSHPRIFKDGDGALVNPVHAKAME